MTNYDGIYVELRPSNFFSSSISMIRVFQKEETEGWILFKENTRSIYTCGNSGRQVRNIRNNKRNKIDLEKVNITEDRNKIKEVKINSATKVTTTKKGNGRI